jgi:hypothetical protein
MFQTIREYQTDESSVAEILATVEKSFVPYISNAPGFSEYTAMDAGNGTIVTTSLFTNRSDGEMFNALAKTWVNENLSSFLPMAPRVISGEVGSHATGKVLAS